MGWPAIVLLKSKHHRNKADDAVTVALVGLDILCDYTRSNVIPTNKQWFSHGNGRSNNCSYIRALAEQILLSSACEYKMHRVFENAMDTISNHSIGKRYKKCCFHLEEWKKGKA